ncbi:hypothetical protein F1C16_08045 [Hymenobacter sp. NBH84]|uniref:hypothetical protein n=1 Tax=Hymenobacter sp. NBH84 TaxID=2596915 RepID=UPI00162598F4|nr:hypothetical protein [Hymenobacter sp. NBH84]QNE39507.1 hypothetical protein F1C16_08045 [Hymenobacter sp. NBH84]
MYIEKVLSLNNGWDFLNKNKEAELLEVEQALLLLNESVLKEAIEGITEEDGDKDEDVEYIGY